VKYSAVAQQEGAYPVTLMCRVMDIKTCGYYAWKKRSESILARNRRELTEEIKLIFEAKRQVYGSPRITQELKDQGRSHSKNYVAKLMKGAGIVAKVGRRKFKCTTDSQHSEPVFPNIVQRNFHAIAPNTVWVSDITYIWTTEGWMYLCVFIDLFSRRVVGWSLGERISSKLVTTALQMAIIRRKPGAGLIVHSDRGVQYASKRYRKLLGKYLLCGSMSRKGDCWDNAVAESFFGTLKQEHVPKHGYLSKLQARSSVFEYIEVFYNRERKHSTIGNLTPVEFELAA